MIHTATLVIEITDENPTNATISVEVKSPEESPARVTLYNILDMIAKQLASRSDAAYAEIDGKLPLDLKTGVQVGQGPKAEA